MNPRVAVITFYVLVFSIGCTRPGVRPIKDLLEAPPQRVSVTIAVTGVAHLVGNEPNQRLLVLPNLTKIVHDGQPIHEPLLLANTKFAPQGFTEKPRKQENTAIKFAWKRLLRGVEIDLASSGVDIPSSPDLQFLEESDDRARCPPPHGNEPRNSLHWIPELATAGGIPNATSDRALTRDAPAADDVSVRLNLVSGSLVPELPTVPFVVRFDDQDNNPRNDRQQAVAQFLAYTFEANVRQGEPFVLMGREFETGQSVFLGSFTPKDGKVRIVLANMPPEHFFNPSSAGNLAHFSQYFRIYGPNAQPVFRTVSAGTCGNDRPVNEVIDCGPGRVRR